jgi:hypothetical protein
MLPHPPARLKKINLFQADEPKEMLRGIYSFDGDTLRLCLPDSSGLDRPTRFAAGGESFATLLTLERFQALVLSVGKATKPFEATWKSVSIDDPDVADITPVDDKTLPEAKEFQIKGKKAGYTILTIVDQDQKKTQLGVIVNDTLSSEMERIWGHDVGPQVIVPPDSTWKYLHPTGGIDPATQDEDFHTTFANLDYDDSRWQTGQDSAGPRGGFGYGDDVGVLFGMPREPHRKIAYFRHRFRTAVPMSKLSITLQRDDGVIIYLNGKEVWRDNIVPHAKEAYDLFAMNTVGGDEETRPIRIPLRGSLDPGEHVLAISLHNREGGSSDLRIAEISLRGTRSTSP